MSSKSSQGPKKISLPAPPPAPRALADITAEYQQKAIEAGQSQYQAFVHSEDVKSLNRRLLELNREAAERNKLDAEAKKEESKDA